MQRSFFLFFLILIPFLSYSQVGVSLNFHKVNSSEWTDSQSRNLKASPFIGTELDYSFRLKKIRWYILPTASFALAKSSNGEFRLGVAIKNHIYPFDLIDDCNCPDFSESKNNIKKSLFFALAPGIYYSDVTSKLDDNIIHHEGITYQIAIGAGYDFELNDMFSLTPIIQYIISSKLTEMYKNNQIKTSLDGLFVSLRGSFRINHRKRGRMRRF